MFVRGGKRLLLKKLIDTFCSKHVDSESSTVQIDDTYTGFL